MEGIPSNIGWGFRGALISRLVPWVTGLGYHDGRRKRR